MPHQNSRYTYVGPFRWRCEVCKHEHLMEARAARCHPPIYWRP